MKNNNLFYRLLKEKLFKAMIVVFSLVSALPLLIILAYITKKGISSVNLNFLLELPKPVGETGGGIFNSLIGSCLLLVLPSIFFVPIGIASGIYLSESKNNKFAHLLRISSDILQGIPSIIIGITGYALIVKPMGNFSAFSGAVVLGIIMLPFIIKSTEETLKLLPYNLKEAALSLGVPYHRMVLKVLLPCGLSGIVTGILLSVSRIAGETAPLLFTAFGNPFLNANIFKPIDSLPHVIFNYAKSPYPEWHSLAWGASFLLVMLVLFINLTTRLIITRWKIKF